MGARKETGIVNQIDFILNEIEELKALFILGRRLIPFLEELFNFVREIAPVLDEINKSLEESSNKIPRASNQLTKVTKTTEMATTEILDALDEMSLKFGEIKGFLNAMKLCHDKQKKLARRMDRYLKKRDFESAENLWGKFSEVLKNCDGFDDILEKLSDAKQSADNIMMALQFQDITAQQISAINHLIGSVQEKLSNLLERLGNIEHKSFGAKLPEDNNKDSSFNSLAEYVEPGSKQKIVDKVIKDLTNNIASEDGNPASQEEIDRLFNEGEKERKEN
jgi:chemotaxis regulatin CheY-phosphate phosphatase CheZ